MHLQDIDSNIPFIHVLSDPELIKEIQAILKVEQTGVLGPTTNQTLWRFCFEQRLDNFETQLFGPTLAKRLLEKAGKKVEESAFEKGLKFVLQWEGGYVFNKADKGGETNKGVTWGTYNLYRDNCGRPRQSVKHITDAEVRDIYRTFYWDAAGCNQLPPKIAISIFNWQVNSGRGVRYLQQCVGAKDDGRFGPKTLNDVNAYIKKHGEEMLVGSFLQSCEMAYKRWGVKDQKCFLQGWLNRLNALRQFLEDLR